MELRGYGSRARSTSPQDAAPVQPPGRERGTGAGAGFGAAGAGAGGADFVAVVSLPACFIRHGPQENGTPPAQRPSQGHVMVGTLLPPRRRRCDPYEQRDGRDRSDKDSGTRAGRRARNGSTEAARARTDATRRGQRRTCCSSGTPQRRDSRRGVALAVVRQIGEALGAAVAGHPTFGDAPAIADAAAPVRAVPSARSGDLVGHGWWRPSGRRRLAHTRMRDRWRNRS
jgi:hypothetical protein